MFAIHYWEERRRHLIVSKEYHQLTSKLPRNWGWWLEAHRKRLRGWQTCMLMASSWSPESLCHHRNVPLELNLYSSLLSIMNFSGVCTSLLESLYWGLDYKSALWAQISEVCSTGLINSVVVFKNNSLHGNSVASVCAQDIAYTREEFDHVVCTSMLHSWSLYHHKRNQTVQSKQSSRHQDSL